jgi:hypothetical protein
VTGVQTCALPILNEDQILARAREYAKKIEASLQAPASK